MSVDDIDIRTECGCVLVTGIDDANQHRRWWFEINDSESRHCGDSDTDAKFSPSPDGDEVTFIAEVVDFEHERSEDVGVDGRHYVPENKASVPEPVANCLTERDFTIVDTDGEVIA